MFLKTANTETKNELFLNVIYEKEVFIDQK